MVESYSDLAWKIGPPIEGSVSNSTSTTEGMSPGMWFRSKFAGGMCPAACGTWQGKEKAGDNTTPRGGKFVGWIDICTSVKCQTHS